MGPAAAEVMRLWEAGSSRDPLDRAVLFACAAGEQLEADAVLDLPLGERDRLLLGLYHTWFGPTLDVRAPCPACDLDLELEVAIDDLLAIPAADRRVVELSGTPVRVRLPTTRDLRAIRGLRSADEARRALADRLLVGTGDASPDAVAEALVDADPLAEVRFRLVCPECEHTWSGLLEIVEFLWGRIEDRAVRLLDEVCTIARVFHWSESEILALSPRRRAFYVAAAEG